MFSIRPVREGDYATVNAWWEERGMEAWPVIVLTAHGVMVEMEGLPVCAGWLFLVEASHVAFFHGLVSRPGLGMGQAANALRHLMAGLDIIMREAGRTLMLGTVPEGAMLKRAAKLGFSAVGSEALHTVVRVVHPNSTEK